MLSMDAVQRANSGHPGAPLGQNLAQQMRSGWRLSCAAPVCCSALPLDKRKRRSGLPQRRVITSGA
ncbi:hypothetical protein ACFSFZ_13430 [Mixta tenebrionis]|uniref:hypothetical protein n=1 Tax=Mixta tenebrionis TaxID=2562439 RepID=UPI0015E85F63